MSARKQVSMTAPEDRDRGQALRNDCSVGGAVNPDGQARNHHSPRSRHGRAYPSGDEPALVGRPASADDGHDMIRRHCLDRASNVEDRRRQVDETQPSRIGRFLERHDLQAEGTNTLRGSSAVRNSIADTRSQVPTDSRHRHPGSPNFRSLPYRTRRVVRQSLSEQSPADRRRCHLNHRPGRAKDRQ